MQVFGLPRQVLSSARGAARLGEGNPDFSPGGSEKPLIVA